MKKILLALTLMGAPALAQPNVPDYTHEAMGCMMIQDCKDGVVKINSIADLETYYGEDGKFDLVGEESDALMKPLKEIGIGVYIAPSTYFVPGHRGVYFTVGNNFFLNEQFVHRPSTLMTVMRHEGWHVVQDCMAGTVDNNMIAIVLPEETVPGVWREQAERHYPEDAVPWEAEAKWAGWEDGMTQRGLEACAAGAPWEAYEPTPLTRAWLVENNYIKE